MKLSTRASEPIRRFTKRSAVADARSGPATPPLPLDAEPLPCCMYALAGRGGRDVVTPRRTDLRTMRNEGGGIEGMPLQLMIMVIVAGLTLAVVLGWILSIQAPAVIKSVTTSPSTVYLGNVPEDQPATKVITLTVTAYDAKNAPLKEIAVALGGAVAGPRVAPDPGAAGVGGPAALPRPGGGGPAGLQR